MNKQILEDAIESGMWIPSDADRESFVITKDELTKFAELTKASHELQSLKTIAEIRAIFNLHKPMIDELPELIKQELTKASAIPDGYVLVPMTLEYDEKKWKAITVDYGAVADINLGLKCHVSQLPLPPNAQQPMKVSD